VSQGTNTLNREECFNLFSSNEKLHLKTEADSSRRNCVSNKRTMDNIQNCDSHMNIPSLETYRSYEMYSLIGSDAV
jgi:hypothetical protein